MTLIPGDGIGPELTEATRRVLEATGVEFEWDVQEAGADVMDKHGGTRCPITSSSRSERNNVALKGPITTPVGGGLPLRQRRAAQDARPLRRRCARARATRGVRSRYEDVDLVIVRENDRGPVRGHRVRGRLATTHAS